MRGFLEALPFLLFVAAFIAIAVGGDVFRYLGGIAMSFSPLLFLLILGVIFLLSAVKIIPEYERAVVFRLGRVIGTKGPGLIIVIPLIDRIVRVSNVSVQVDAVVYFRVVDPSRAIVEVEDYLYATSQIAQTTLRSVCGEAELDELLSRREKINIKLQEIIDRQTDPWGVKVVAVELKKIDLPDDLRGEDNIRRGGVSGSPEAPGTHSHTAPLSGNPSHHRTPECQDGGVSLSLRVHRTHEAKDRREERILK